MFDLSPEKRAELEAQHGELAIGVAPGRYTVACRKVTMAEYDVWAKVSDDGDALKTTKLLFQLACVWPAGADQTKFLARYALAPVAMAPRIRELCGGHAGPRVVAADGDSVTVMEKSTPPRWTVTFRAPTEAEAMRFGKMLSDPANRHLARGVLFDLVCTSHGEADRKALREAYPFVVAACGPALDELMGGELAAQEK